MISLGLAQLALAVAQHRLPSDKKKFVSALSWGPKMKRQPLCYEEEKGNLYNFCSSVILWQVDSLTNPSYKISRVSK